MRFLLILASALALAACDARDTDLVGTAGNPVAGSGASSGGSSGTATSGGATSTGGATPTGSTTGNQSATTGTVPGGTGSTTGALPTTQLRGEHGFDAGFVGELYGLLPDGGPDLSNLDCRISDGTDQAAACDERPTARGTPSHTIVDLFVSNASGNPLSQGTAYVEPASAADGGDFATIEVTLIAGDGGSIVLQASSGFIVYQVSATETFGEFSAFLPIPDGGGAQSELDGRFGATYCGTLGGY